MRKLIFCATSAVVLALLGGAADAAPYASLIRVSSTTFNGSMTISYRLNEAADSVQVEVLDAATSTVAAAFTGPAAQGANHVTWNGTADNLGGLTVTDGQYRVRITADKNSGTSWSQLAANAGNPGGTSYPTRNLFANYYPHDHNFITDTDSDNFGIGLSVNSMGAVHPPTYANICLNSDLSPVAGDGYQNRVLRAVQLEAAPVSPVYQDDMYNLNNGVIDGDRLYATGQDGPSSGGYRIWVGSLTTSATMSDADPVPLLSGARTYPYYPNDIVVGTTGANKHAYVTHWSAITKIPLDPVTGRIGRPVLIARVVKSAFALAMDAQGNLYHATPGDIYGDRTSGTLLRWNASQVAAATQTNPLTEANAVWSVYNSASAYNMNDVTITPDGEVYVILVQGSERGIYNVGNVSQPSLVKNLSTSDRRVDISEIPVLNDVATGISADPVGNIVMFTLTLGRIFLFGPSGNHSNAIVAPTSQTFTIMNSSVPGWGLY